MTKRAKPKRRRQSHSPATQTKPRGWPKWAKISLLLAGGATALIAVVLLKAFPASSTRLVPPRPETQESLPSTSVPKRDNALPAAEEIDHLPPAEQIAALKKEQLALAEGLVAEFSNATEPWIILGKIYRRHGDPDKAVEQWQVALKQSPIQLTDVTEATGIAFRHTDGGTGQRYIVETVSAGLALFDYDGDGDIDIYFLNGAALEAPQSDAPPRNRLYRNEGDWRFTDVTDASGLGDTGYGLGIAVGDYDNDGDPDVYLNNYGVNVLYRNNADGTFVDVTKDAGLGQAHRVGAGACFLDLDNDGDIDVVVLNSRREPTLLRNDSPAGGHWLQIELQGDRSNRDGIGARVIVKAGDLQLTDEVHSGRGYQSHYGTRLHFGLGRHLRVDWVEVHWLGGSVDRLKDIAADRLIHMTEGQAR